MPINVTIWNEFVHEQNILSVPGIIYPDGMHNAIKDGLSHDTELNIITATLDMPEHGLTQEVVDNTDVMLWWGHTAHGRVEDEIVNRVYTAVLKGMGIIILHSGHASKIFTKLCGTSGALTWRECGENGRLWVTCPSHPIAAGIPAWVDIPCDECYGEYFDIPKPDDIVFTGWFKGGDVFRSGCTFTRGYGKMFYFQPGHETYPVYKDPMILKIIGNAIHWANPTARREAIVFPHTVPREADIHRALRPQDFGGEKHRHLGPFEYETTVTPKQLDGYFNPPKDN